MPPAKKAASASPAASGTLAQHFAKAKASAKTPTKDRVQESTHEPATDASPLVGNRGGSNAQKHRGNDQGLRK
jgi:hypothetical protein